MNEQVPVWKNSLSNYLLECSNLIEKHKLATIDMDRVGEWFFRQYFVKTFFHLKSFLTIRETMDVNESFPTSASIVRSCLLDSIIINYVIRDSQNASFSERDLDYEVSIYFSDQILALVKDYKNGKREEKEFILKYINNLLSQFLSGNASTLEEVKHKLKYPVRRSSVQYMADNGLNLNRGRSLFLSYSLFSKIDHSGPITGYFMNSSVKHQYEVERTINEALYNIIGTHRDVLTGLSHKLVIDITKYIGAYGELQNLLY